MAQLQIIDTFDSFLEYWEGVKERPQLQQISAWHDQYMARWPELRQKQIDCYSEEGDDWLAVANEFVFPHLPKAIPAMQTAHDNLLMICEGVHNQCQERLNFNNDLVCVIYVGIGLGAGWATTYMGKPAVLFGLENIAQENWQEKDALVGLMAHELGHLVHFYQRENAGLTDGKGPWWQLYTEGFAQFCEQLLLDQPSWHMRKDNNGEWLHWCQDNLGWLAAEFLRRVDEGEDMRPFFGSWFELRGYKQTGYFLGYELIRTLRENSDLDTIALLTDLEEVLRPILQKMAILKTRYQR